MTKTLSLFALVFCASIAAANPPTTTTTTSTTLAPSTGGDITCTNVSSGAPVSLANACSAAPTADADAVCALIAGGSDADAAAICGNLNFNVQAQLCAPYVHNNIHSICAPAVNADVDSYCSEYVSNRVETEVSQRCGDARAFCQGDHDYLNIALKLGDVSARCKQAQHQVQMQDASCTDASVNSFDASQTCAAAQQSCTQSNSNSNVNNCPPPPDIQAVCARQRSRRIVRRVFDPITAKRVKAVDFVVTCVKWAKPVIEFTQPK